MAKRALADSIYIAVYEDEDGKDCFAFWGGWDNRRIRWYKTKAEGERQLAEVKGTTRGERCPANTRIVRFRMEVEAEDVSA